MAATAQKLSRESAPALLPVKAPPQVGQAPGTPGVSALVGALLASILLAGLGVVTVRMEGVQRTYQLNRLAASKKDAMEEGARLRAELAALHSPEALAPQALLYGLRAPDPNDIHPIEMP